MNLVKEFSYNGYIMAIRGCEYKRQSEGFKNTPEEYYEGTDRTLRPPKHTREYKLSFEESPHSKKRRIS